MNVSLPQTWEEFVAGQVSSGEFGNASEVVREALRHFRAQDDPAEVDSRELAELLLPAVRGPHRPLTAKHFDPLRLRARRMQ